MPYQDTANATINDAFYYNEAMKALNAGRIEEALSNIDMAISLSSNKPLYLIYKIKLLYSANLYTECNNLILNQLHYLYTYCSLKDFAQLLPYYQESCECSIDELAELFACHKIPPTLAYEYAMILETTDYNFHSKALEYKKAGNYKACVDCCKLALKLEPHSISLLHLQATCYMAMEDFKSIIQLYEEMISIHSLTSEIAYPLALAYMHENNLLKAIGYFKYFVQINPSHPEALSYLGDCYLKSQRYSEAIEVFEKLIESNTFIPTYYLKLGEIYTLLNRKRIANKYYRQANKLQTENFATSSSNKLFKWLPITLVGVIALIIQLYCFKAGIIPPLIYNVKVTVDNSIIPVNGFTDFEVSYSVFPGYAKMPTYEVISADSDIACVIEGLDALNGFKAGTTTFDVILGSKSRASFSIKVIEDPSLAP